MRGIKAQPTLSWKDVIGQQKFSAGSYSKWEPTARDSLTAELSSQLVRDPSSCMETVSPTSQWVCVPKLMHAKHSRI